ncbi:MAG: hypothetical protein HZB62_12575 [Nitrospirae bacterium]|nr:hypothetical protein [Nitrospirota bacterium]
MKTIIPELDSAELRKFGLLMAAFLVAFLGLIAPWLFGVSFPVWPWIVAAVLFFFSLTYPVGIRPLYMGWMRVALVAGSLNNYLLLSLVFIVIIVPMGMLMRLSGYDPLRTKAAPDCLSFRKKSASRSIKNMERPY